MKDAVSFPFRLWRLAYLSFRWVVKSGKAVHKWCKKYPKLAAFLILSPPLLLFSYFLAVTSMEEQDWQSRHCRKTGRSNVPTVVVVHEDFPLTPTSHATYEYECDDGRMMWLTY